MDLSGSGRFPDRHGGQQTGRSMADDSSCIGKGLCKIAFLNRSGTAVATLGLGLPSLTLGFLSAQTWQPRAPALPDAAYPRTLLQIGNVQQNLLRLESICVPMHSRRPAAHFQLGKSRHGHARALDKLVSWYRTIRARPRSFRCCGQRSRNGSAAGPYCRYRGAKQQRHHHAGYAK